jgi:peptidoglycan-associated lipoprotein
MNGFKHHRWSFLAVMLLCFAVATTSCSKKDVKEDEPSFSPTESAGADASGTGGDTGAALGGAGDSFSGAPELQTVYYDFDSYNLNSQGRDALKANAQWLTENPTATIQVEGHCDERGTTEYNLALGERRANASRDYLQKLGVDASRMSVISYGEERPLDPSSGESAWAKNRRAQFVILSR